MKPLTPGRILSVSCLLATAIGCVHAANSPEPEGAKSITRENTVLVTVNGRDITQDLYAVYNRSKNPGKPASKGSAEQQMVLLSELINFSLLEQDAVENQLDRLPGVAAQLELARMRMLANAALGHHLIEHQISDKELKTAYEAKTQAGTLMEFKVRHILLDSQSDANSVIKRLEKGEDFATVARDSSTDTSAKQGGELGWLSQGQMDPAIENALTGMKAQSFSTAPVKSAFGWHVLLLEESRPVPQPSFAEMRASLISERQKAQLSQYISDLRSRAEVKSAKPTAPGIKVKP
jgi:peptidyl-prolyl cis-trans isomerase C